MRKALLSAAAIAIGAAVSACSTSQAGNSSEKAMAHQAMMAPPGGAYQKVSGLVPLPDFIPGLGTLYVQPDTLPDGPFQAYDRTGKLVSTIYMIPLKDIEAHKKIEDLQIGPDQNVVGVEMYYNAGHPGVPEPHYHVVLWHVPEDEAQLQ